jgi:hypothetical protein
LKLTKPSIMELRSLTPVFCGLESMRRMRIIGKAIVVTVLASLGVGILLGLWLTLLGKVQGDPGDLDSRMAQVLEFVFAALMLSYATTLPVSLLGGALAGIALQRQRSAASIWIWLIRGVGVGSILGALGAPATPLLFGWASQSPAAGSMLAMFSLAGAAGGVVTGALIAAWCYRAQQTLPLAGPGRTVPS